MNVWDIVGIGAILLLVAANGFFVAAEFSLVAVRRSRVTQLVQDGAANAKPLQHAVETLDSHLAATQLGITLSSLALGWVGEPALAHLIEPPLVFVLGEYAGLASHAVAVALAFVVITMLHIVVGELAPKSLALQRSEATALAVVRPLNWFLVVFRPAIVVLNGMGNMLLRAAGLRPASGEEQVHSAEEIELLVAESQKAGVVDASQQEAVARIFDIGNHDVRSIMTPRHEIDWIDIQSDADEIRKSLQESHHRQLVVADGIVDEPVGVVSKKDILEQLLAGGSIDVNAALKEPLYVLDTARVFPVLEKFKAQPVRIALVVDEYGQLEGIVTQSDLLNALAGDLADADDPTDEIGEIDGVLTVDGKYPISDLLNHLGLPDGPRSYHTAAGMVLHHLKRIPNVGDSFLSEGFRFEVSALDRHRVASIRVHREPTTREE
ncbi:hemolysin family protein [Devosia epidermidihirudinis]|uniref:hemolysin family protein n=1 Tax=Devosia epidermidihirudinis TaxID=1293439 RepID=UPI000A6C6E9B|nr:hemolysin family protein [Devosia epidermidihirudinis]